MALAQAPRRCNQHCCDSLKNQAIKLPLVLQHLSVRCHAVSEGADVSLNRRYEFETRVAQKCLQFESATVGDKQVVIVSGVRGPCYEAGIQPGDQLTGISDTNRDEVWELDDMASLRFVYMSMKMRIPQTITITTRKNPPEWVDAALADATQKQQAEAEEASGANTGGEQQYLDEVLQSMSSDDESPPSPTAAAPGVVPPSSEAERQLLIKAQQRRKEVSRSQERIQNRKNYMEQVGQRNDAPFIATVFAFFFLPAAIILAVAFSSGYIDSLSGMYRP